MQQGSAGIHLYDPWIASIGEGSVLGLPKKLSLRCAEVARQVRSPEGYEYSVLLICCQVGVLVLHGPSLLGYLSILRRIQVMSKAKGMLRRSLPRGDT